MVFCFARLHFSEHEKLRRTQLAKAIKKSAAPQRLRCVCQKYVLFVATGILLLLLLYLWLVIKCRLIDNENMRLKYHIEIFDKKLQAKK